MKSIKLFSKMKIFKTAIVSYLVCFTACMWFLSHWNGLVFQIFHTFIMLEDTILLLKYQIRIFLQGIRTIKTYIYSWDMQYNYTHRIFLKNPKNYINIWSFILDTRGRKIFLASSFNTTENSTESLLVY